MSCTRTFGGHVAGQSLVSAVRTVDDALPGALAARLLPAAGKPQGAHGVSRRARCARAARSAPGGSTPSSTARRSSRCRRRFRPIRTASSTRTRCQPAPAPDELTEVRSTAYIDNEGWAQFQEWDLRIVPREHAQADYREGVPPAGVVPPPRPAARRWVLHICALAYMSDLTLLGSAQVTHPEERKHLQVASLDHAMWFMRPFRADEWLLYDQSSPSACGGRALTQGKIFNRNGEMVAAVMQEGLTRYRRDYIRRLRGERAARRRPGPAGRYPRTPGGAARSRSRCDDSAPPLRARRRRRAGDPRWRVHHDEPPAGRVRLARAAARAGWPTACRCTGRVRG